MAHWFRNICHFSISPIFNLVTTNNRYKNSPERFFSLFSRSHPLGFYHQFSKKKKNNFWTTKPILNHKVTLNRAHQDLKVCLSFPPGVPPRTLEPFFLFYSNLMIFSGILSVLRYCINFQTFILRGTHYEVSRGLKLIILHMLITFKLKGLF